MSTNAHLEIQKLKIRQLIEDYRGGRLMIPEFQREYVWKPARAPRLLDSIYRGYPISVLLLWTNGAESRGQGRAARSSGAGPVSWVIDGQQRLITLSRILSGDEGIEVVFHPEQDKFRLANGSTRRDHNWIRVSELLDDHTYRQIRRSLPEGSKGERREARFDRLRRVLDYEIPAVQMINHSFEEAVESFTRINTLGVRLKTEDIYRAKVAARHTHFIANEVTPFVEELRRQGFGRLNVMHLFRVSAFLAMPDGRNRTPLHELSRSGVQAAWARTRKAAQDMIAIIREEFGLANMDMLWSGALLVPAMALCASGDGVRRPDPKAIAGWIAMAALLHRYGRSSDTSLDQDLRACRAADAIGRLLGNLRRDQGLIGALPSDFQASTNDKGALFATYVACRAAGLRDLFSGAEVGPDSELDRHQIFPRAHLPERLWAQADTVANAAFAAHGVRRAGGQDMPEVYLAKIRPEVLRSQCIPADKSLWNIDRAEEFLIARRDLLTNAFNRFLQRTLPGRRIEAPGVTPQEDGSDAVSAAIRSPRTPAPSVREAGAAGRSLLQKELADEHGVNA